MTTGRGTLEPRQLLAVPSTQQLVVISPESTFPNNPPAPTKVKEIVITQRGAYNIQWHIWLRDGAPTDVAYAQVYKNGVPWGTLHSTAPEQLIAELQQESLGGWEEGDLCQLYIWTKTTDRNVVASNFGLWATYNLMPPNIPAGVINLSGA